LRIWNQDSTAAGRAEQGERFGLFFIQQNQSSRTGTADDEAQSELWQMSEHFALISFLDCLSEQDRNHCRQ
jgi:hypothetical protein